MELTGKQKAHLRGLAHDKNAVLFVGREGASEAVIRKANIELEAHELIKGRVGDGCEASVADVAAAIAAGTQSGLVQVIGHTFSLYRRRKKKPEIVLPAVSKDD